MSSLIAIIGIMSLNIVNIKITETETMIIGYNVMKTKEVGHFKANMITINIITNSMIMRDSIHTGTITDIKEIIAIAIGTIKNSPTIDIFVTKLKNKRPWYKVLH